MNILPTDSEGPILRRGIKLRNYACKAIQTRFPLIADGRACYKVTCGTKKVTRIPAYLVLSKLRETRTFARAERSWRHR